MIVSSKRMNLINDYNLQIAEERPFIDVVRNQDGSSRLVFNRPTCDKDGFCQFADGHHNTGCCKDLEHAGPQTCQRWIFRPSLLEFANELANSCARDSDNGCGVIWLGQ